MTITFGAICSLLQSVENISSRKPPLPPQQEKETISEITANWFINQRKHLDDPGTSGAAVLSALFPHRRKDRVYGLQAPLLAKKLTTLLNFGHGQKILFDGWKTGKLGDLGVYAERAMAKWDGTFKTKHVFPIEEIDQLLVQLAAKYRFSDEAIRRQRIWHVRTDTVLRDILIRLESWEAKWLVRLILRDHCTIELDERQVLGQYHFLLPDLLMFQNDFDAVFEMLRGDLSMYPAMPKPTQEKSLRIEASQKLRAIVGVKVGRPAFHKAWSFKNCFQLVGNRAWAAEVKYDGEYCEIHIDLQQGSNDIKIFSKNGKDATADREPLHSTIRKALRIGRPDCLVKSNCIVLGEMVLYSDKERRILPFSKIRKHISRSGSFIGTLQDSLPHEWEHLMIVFFDVLVLNNQPILRHCLQDRRKVLRDLVEMVPGRSMRSEWTLLDFKTGDGIMDLKQAFARNITNRQEGLVLKPLHAPYFPLLTDKGHQQAGFFIKLKKDYLGDMGGERDLGDFAIVGASFDAQVASKCALKPLHWTHFHVGCCTNKAAVERSGAKPRFKIVATLSLDKCIPKPDAKYLNIQGYVQQVDVGKGGVTDAFTIEQSQGSRRMTVAFKKPFVAEILGGGFEQLQNETFEMLRHPRVRKLHHDHTWEDCVTLDDLERMAAEKWDVPDADKLDGHVKDVALLVKRYRRDMCDSQATITTDNTTQETTPRSTQETTSTISPIPQLIQPFATDDSTVQETPQNTYTTSSTLSPPSRTPVPSLRILVREDTCERLHLAPAPLPTPASTAETVPAANATTGKKRSFTELISPPSIKRRQALRSLTGNRSLGAVECDSQEGVVRVYVGEGVRVEVHTGNEGGGEKKG
jgi:DNA ligase-4